LRIDGHACHHAAAELTSAANVAFLRCQSATDIATVVRKPRQDIARESGTLQFIRGDLGIFVACFHTERHVDGLRSTRLPPFRTGLNTLAAFTARLMALVHSAIVQASDPSIPEPSARAAANAAFASAVSHTDSELTKYMRTAPSKVAYG
jgi:hypothetical protein